MLTLVIARFHESVSWVTRVHAHVMIVHKEQIGNTGREAASWLWFITTHYDGLHGDYLFCQGNPYAHCRRFSGVAGQRRHYGRRIRCDWTGAPNHSGLLLEEAITALKLEVPQRIEFTAGGQFQATAEQIRGAHSRDYYRQAWKMAMEFPEGPWVFERLWDYLIPAQVVDVSECRRYP